MLEVDFKLNPYGCDQGVVNIGNIYIVNVGGKFGNYNYVYLIYEPTSRFSEEIIKHGVIADHNQHQAFSKLLQKVMIDYGESECDLSQQYADHWLKELKGED